MHDCVVTTGTTGICSLSYESSFTRNFLFLSFRSGNVYYQVCLGSGPRELLLPKKLLSLLSSDFSLSENPPSCLILINFDERVATCLNRSLPGKCRLMVINWFGVTELEKCLAMPTSKILERHDFRTILDFLLMKLRTAMDQEWLQSIPVLHKVHFSVLLYLQYTVDF